MQKVFKELTELGWVNDDVSRPKIDAAVDQCSKLNHERVTVQLGPVTRCQRKVSCFKCGYSFKVDSSD